jgi:Flp pilus assembly protein TadG
VVASSILDVLARFRGNKQGNLAVTFSLCLLPIALAVGMATDYSSATNNRSTMQNALDAATLSLANLPETMTDPQREAKLQEFYLGNGGTGTAKLTRFVISAKGDVDAASSASYDMPTNFMQLAKVTKVPIGVVTEMHKEPTLVEAKFEIRGASGWWDKTMTLKGKKYGQTNYDSLMEIKYTYVPFKYNNVTEPKGYGTMQARTMKKNPQGTYDFTLVQEQKCTTQRVNNSYSERPGDIITESSGVKFRTTCAFTGGLPGSGTADVSTMEDIYLEMDVPSAANATPKKPRYLKSNDPVTADRLYIDGVEVVANGKPVDIFSVVPCGEPRAFRI